MGKVILLCPKEDKIFVAKEKSLIPKDWFFPDKDLLCKSFITRPNSLICKEKKQDCIILHMNNTISFLNSDDYYGFWIDRSEKFVKKLVKQISELI